MDRAELMQKEIENKRKLPEEIKKEIKKSIFHNLLIAVIIILYLCTINILFYKLENQVFEQQMKFFALGLISITVVVFEVAYQRQSKRTAIVGIELLLFSIISLYIPYIYLFANVNLKLITTILPLSIAGYYLIKALIIYKSGRMKHENNLSDVKEILKDSENQSYLDEESKKSYRELKEIEEKNNQELLEEQHKKAIESKKASKNKSKKGTKNKKTTSTVSKSKSKTEKKSKSSTSSKSEVKSKSTTAKAKTEKKTTANTKTKTETKKNKQKQDKGL